ncbi:MAG: hypothetical protein HY791_17970 [Deltaproteobacteria bacterium]|nr:hypothetical protein [Deltaproteobacteria bacterium]
MSRRGVSYGLGSVNRSIRVSRTLAIVVSSVPGEPFGALSARPGRGGRLDIDGAGELSALGE